MDEERDDEGTAPPYEFSGGESSGDEGDGDSGDSESGDSGDDERTAPAYEFSGGESSGEGDSGEDSGEDEEDDEDDNVLPDEERMADTDAEPTGSPPGDRSAPEYAFSAGESSGEDDAPLEGGVRRGAPEYEFSGGQSSGEADEDKDKAPPTAATKTPHGDFTARHRAERERAQEARKAREAEAEQRDRRKSRLLKIGAAVVGALVIAGILILISTSGTDKATRKGGEQQGPAVGAVTINDRFKGVPQQGLALGDPKAPVTLVEFADLQCPFCKQAADNSLPTLVDRYVKPGKLRIEFRNWPILGPDSEKAARALAGAADQNLAWQFLDLWYLNQGEENTGYVTDAFISRIASGVQGLDAQKVVAASNDQANTESIDVANSDAKKFGIDSTPSFLIGPTGGQMQLLQLQDPSNPALFGQAIDQLLGQK